MLQSLADWLIDPAGLTAHGFCLSWEPGLIWTHAVADSAIGLTYYSIPLALAIFARRRRDLMFRPLFVLFAAFILLCGTVHWLDVLTLWVPAYGLQGAVKVATALVSAVTAVSLWWLLPQALALPSPAQLRDANDALHASEERLRQAQKMEAVGQLTGGIAHDFNNMLQGIGGCLDLMAKRMHDGRAAEAERYIAPARQSVERAAGLIHRMLAFARRQALQPRPVDPDTLVRDMAELIRRTTGPAIQLALTLRGGQWRGLCDANQLESALLNLAINARDAMPKGGQLTILTAGRTLQAGDLSEPEETEPGDYVEIAVSDTGSGMPAEVMARVFEPFFTTKPIGQGTGLGLSQVYGFVRQSGGFVRLESAPEQGTTVHLFLPRHHATDAEPLAAPPEVAKPGRPTHTEARNRIVLLVEDEPGVRSLVVEALHDQGCRVLQAVDGAEGLRIAQSAARLDLLITDVGLPGLNGRELADLARRLRPDLPVLLITGYAGNALEELSATPGIEVMHKPFAIDALTERVHVLLEPRLVR